jgi:hypothetical protein
MSSTPPLPVISGKPYAVRSVRDRAPSSLEDFLGETSFVLDLDGEAYVVHGPGVTADPGVRVFEKADRGQGKDIRCWLVVAAPDEEVFTATHVGVDVPPQAVRSALT